MGSKTQFRRPRCILANKACRLFPCEAMHTCASTTQENSRRLSKRVCQCACCRNAIGGDRCWLSKYHWLPSSFSPIWPGGIFLPVMENTTDVSTESDTVLNCRLRYRCFYSSLWTCFVSQLPDRDIADANRLFVSLLCTILFFQSFSTHTREWKQHTPSCSLSEKIDLSLTCWPDMLICYLSDIWHPISPLLPSSSVSLMTIHTSRPYWMFVGTKTNTHRAVSYTHLTLPTIYSV